MSKSSNNFSTNHISDRRRENLFLQHSQTELKTCAFFLESQIFDKKIESRANNFADKLNLSEKGSIRTDN